MEETYETFFARFERPRARKLLGREEVVAIRATYLIAKEGHRHRYREETDGDGRPVREFEHPRRVAIVAMDEFELYDPVVIMLCLVHDCPEDSLRVDLDIIRRVSGREVARRAALLKKTGRGDQTYLPDLVEYGDWKTLFVKGFDRLDNLRSLHQCDVAKQLKQTIETREKYLPLFERLIEMTPFEHHRRARKLYDLIAAIVAEYEKKFAAPLLP